MKFEIMPLSWFKRRVPQEKEPKVVKYKVIGFKKVDSHLCKMYVKFDNGHRHLLNARVNLNVTYEYVDKFTVIEIPGTCAVQGYNHTGISVLLKLIE